MGSPFVQEKMNKNGIWGKMLSFLSTKPALACLFQGAQRFQ
jgi:hypothetical protein